MRLAFLLLCAVSGMAQSVTVGVKGSVRLTSVQVGYGTAESKPYRVGPTVEVGLPLGFAVEADALYSRLGYTTFAPLIGMQAFSRTRADAWEFPILAKWRIPLPRVRPVASFGLAPRHAAVRVDNTGYQWFDSYANTQHYHARDHAWIVGGGLEVDFGRVRLSPELRYFRRPIARYPTEWNVSYYLTVPENELTLSLGLGWRLRK